MRLFNPTIDPVLESKMDFSEEDARMGCLGRVKESFDVHKHEGVIMITRIGDIVALQGTSAQLRSVAADPDVIYLENSGGSVLE